MVDCQTLPGRAGSGRREPARLVLGLAFPEAWDGGTSPKAGSQEGGPGDSSSPSSATAPAAAFPFSLTLSLGASEAGGGGCSCQRKPAVGTRQVGVLGEGCRGSSKTPSQAGSPAEQGRVSPGVFKQVCVTT